MTSILEEYDHICPACCAILSHGDGSATMVQRRVADLLSQNIPPSDAEAHNLQHTDLDPTPYIARIQKRMDELTYEMARLTIARASLETHPHHVKAILHPMRSLPEDVLREIFLWSTEGDEELYDEWQDSLYPRRPQWVFSQVCRRWRHITLAFPRLWSSLYLYLDRSFIDPSPTSPSILRLAAYLDRSADQKISVHIGAYGYHDSNMDFEHFGPLLRQSTSRWVECKLDRLSLEFVDYIFSNCDFGSLARLCLDVYAVNLFAVTKQKLIAFQNTPLLRSLDYKNRDHKEYPALLPWAQLTTVELGVAALDDVATLKTLTNVQRLTLQLSYLYLERKTLLSLSQKPLRFPYLTSLCLSELVEEDKGKIGQVVSHLEMPAITELELAFGADYAYLSSITPPSFHSSVNLGGLTALSITYTLEDDADGVVKLDFGKLVAFLRLVPNLQKFRLSGFEISSAVFNALSLTLKNGQSNVLPYLQILNFTGSDLAGDVGITSILSMLESRYLSLPGRETNRRSVLTQLSFSPSTVQYITRMCVNNEIRGRWDGICRSILSR